MTDLTQGCGPQHGRHVRSVHVSRMPSWNVVGTGAVHRLSVLFGPAMRRNLWAIADQAITAASNFVLLLVLGRLFGSEDFGAYNMALSLFFLVASLHNSLLIEPMLVFGGRRFRNALQIYFRHVFLIGNGAFGLAALLLFLTVGYALQIWADARIGAALVGVGVAMPCVLLSALLRRACYVCGAMPVAVAGGGVYLSVLLGSTWLLNGLGMLTLILGALPMGVAGGAASAVILVAIRRQPSMEPAPSLLEVTQLHVRYARWSASSEMLHWLVSNLPILALPIWFGLEAPATFKILNLLYMPVFQIVAACNSSLIPVLTRCRESPTFPDIVRRAVLLWCALAVAYGACLALLARPLVAFLYNGRYAFSESWIVLMAVAAIGYSLANVLFAALRALERPDRVFTAYVAMSVVLIGALPFYPAFGMTAVVVSLAVGWAAACGVSAVPAQRLMRDFAHRRARACLVRRCASQRKRMPSPVLKESA